MNIGKKRSSLDPSPSLEDSGVMAETAAPEPVSVEASMNAELPIPEMRSLADPPAPKDPIVELDVFVAISGKKSDQVRGFALWAKKQGIGQRSAPEWEIEWRRYLERPV